MFAFCDHNSGRVNVLCRSCSERFVRITRNLNELRCLNCNSKLEFGFIEQFDLAVIHCRRCDTYSILQGITLEG